MARLGMTANGARRLDQRRGSRGPDHCSAGHGFPWKRNSDRKTPMSEEKQADQRLTVTASSLNFQAAAAAAR
jgi:hypothetical protein